MNIPEYRVGSIRENSLEELQQGERNEELRRKVVERRWTVPECAACAWRNFCQGSCTALSYMRTNDFYATDEYCDFRRELYRRNALAKAGLISDRPTDQAASC
jgi:radical SAM protein with 4Fe4S-binding SPASM domain